MTPEGEPLQLIGQPMDQADDQQIGHGAGEHIEIETEKQPPIYILPPLSSQPPNRRRQMSVFIACLLLLFIFIAGERLYEYSISNPADSGVPVAVRNPVQNPIQNPVQKPVQNEIQPLVPQASPPVPVPAVGATVAPPAAPANPLASVTAWAYLVANVRTGQVYLSRNPDEVLPIASLSKLTTALVARQFMNQSQIVPITQQVMDVYSDAYGIELGEKFTVSELYYPLLLQSNDNVAEAFAYEYTTGNTDPFAAASSSDAAFIQKMNDYAGELGMEHSHFLDASGLSEGNVSTASDLLLLAQFFYADKFSDQSLTPNLLAITTQPSESVSTTTDHFSHDFLNINPFVGNSNFVGGKTGRTNAAGETMISIFNYHHAGQTDPIVVIALHSDYGTRQQDTEKLLSYAEANIAAGK